MLVTFPAVPGGIHSSAAPPPVTDRILPLVVEPVVFNLGAVTALVAIFAAVTALLAIFAAVTASVVTVHP